MKKITAFLLAALLTAGLAACGNQPSPAPGGEVSAAPDEQEKSKDEVTITLWTYPIGSWNNATTVSTLITDFGKKYPNYKVNVEYLDYDTGDAKIAESMENGTLPDLVLEGPERLVANWGEKGVMEDLSDLWESETAAQIYEPVRNACRHRNGSYYEFPICMTAHCMAINYDLFREAGALKYIDEANHTWTTDGFAKAVKALRDYGQEKVGIVYCGGQGGDQGTRALVNNLYGGSFANKDHTGYVFNSSENIKALKFLKNLDGIEFDTASQGSDEIAMFCSGELAMAFCWNVSQEVSQTISNPNLNFDIFPMAFPTSSGDPVLQGGIWGLGIFDNGDAARIEAAKKFIEFITTDDVEYARAVTTSAYWPVRDIPDIYANDELMSEYGIFTPYMADYYQITPGWADVRTAWWTMLQDISAGKNIRQAAADFENTANAAAAAAMDTNTAAQ